VGESGIESMNRDQVVQLLQVVTAYDNRKLDQVLVAAWNESATRGHWEFEPALNAVHDHYAGSTAWIMPGHVTERIKAKSRQPAPAAEVLELDKPIASPERRAELMAEIRKIADRKAVK
jgi:hypothetical protein